MRILTEAEYQRRIEEARMKGYEEASKRIFEDQRNNEFRDDIWRAVRESRQDFDRQIRALVIEMKKAGMEDPLEPKVACCDGSCTPVNMVGY